MTTRKKIPAVLQRMRYREDGEVKEVVCLVNSLAAGGEYTLCGKAILDATLKYEGFEGVGDEFPGKTKEITCPHCRDMVDFIKILQ